MEPYQRLWLVHHYKTTFEISAIWSHLLVPFHIHASYTYDTQLCTERCMNGPHVDFSLRNPDVAWSCLLQNARGLIWTWQMSQTGLGQWNVHESRWRDAWMSTTGRWTNTFWQISFVGNFFSSTITHCHSHLFAISYTPGGVRCKRNEPKCSAVLGSCDGRIEWKAISIRDGGEWNESKKAFRVDDVPVECLKIPSTLP